MERRTANLRALGPVEASRFKENARRYRSMCTLAHDTAFLRKNQVGDVEPGDVDKPLTQSYWWQNGGGNEPVPNVSALNQIYGANYDLKKMSPTAETISVGNVYDPILFARMANTRTAVADVNGDAEVIRALAQKNDMKGSLPSRPQGAITLPDQRRWGINAYQKGIPFKYPRSRDMTDWIAIMAENRIGGGTNPGVEPALYDINGDGRPDVKAERHEPALDIPVGAVEITEETPFYNPSNRPGEAAMPNASPPGAEPALSYPLFGGSDMSPATHPTGRLTKGGFSSVTIVVACLLGFLVLRG